MLFCHVFNFVAAVLFAFCKFAESFEMLFAARLVGGFGCGKYWYFGVGEG